jgi:hypothetical protein
MKNTKSQVYLFVSLALAVAFSLGACGGEQSQEDYFEGVLYDAENPNASVSGGKEDELGNVYQIPTNLPELEAPEVIVSLDGLTVHLFDRQTGFSEVYPTGVGVLNRNGFSITPTGHFTTSPDLNNEWWYIARRTVPAYFGGYPFLRFTATNGSGKNTYGIHGPITSELIRGYVSHGCVRMKGEDVVRLFYLVRKHPATPITIQREIEYDAAGIKVDLDSQVTLWGPDEEILYGDSVGPRPPRDDSGIDPADCADDRLESDQPVSLELNPGLYEDLILCPQDTDIYSVPLDFMDTVTVKIEFDSSVADLDLRTVDENGEILLISAGLDSEESIEFTVDDLKLYFIEVYMFEGQEPCTYSLTLTESYF